MKRIVCPPLAAPQGIIAHWHIQEGASLGGDGTGLPMVDIRLQRGAITTLTMFGDSAGCVLKVVNWVKHAK
ncbi:MAG: hypothetical protein M3Y81_15120, partial [Chloroflexota bacterium]|nr:hypothetical protein [Chloroflexota bacterium]